MALDYRKCAEEIAKYIGGGSNVISAAHCATRLRLVIADNSKLDKKALEDVEGVKGMFESNGQLQLIIGTGTVNKVYDEFLAVTGVSAATKADVKAAAASKMPWWKKILKTPGDIFVPILPAIVASGLMMGIVEAIPKFAPAFGNTGWFAFLDLVANTAFALLPVLVAISAARVFGGNVFLAAVIGLMMVHPSLLNAWNAGSVQGVASFYGRAIPLDAVQNAINGLKPELAALVPADFLSKLPGASELTGGVLPGVINTLPAKASSAVWDYINSSLTVADIGGIPQFTLFSTFGISQMGYQGHVIPVILAVFGMSKLEKGLHKIVPEMIDLFVTPLVTVLVTALLTFTIIGPVFSILENYVLMGAKWLAATTIGAAVMGAIYPWTVFLGLHHMYNVIEAGMIAQTGLNTWMPIASAANFAQFGACLAVAIKAKNAKTRAVALPASLSASLGITEPAIFGVNYRFMKPFLCGMAGGAVGALFGALFKVGAPVYGVTGIPAIPAAQPTLLYIVEILIAAAVAFVLTVFIWREEKPEEKAASEPEKAPELPTVSVIRCAAGTVMQPVRGNVIAREAIPDDTFASGVLGDGVGIEPEDELVVAPFDGTVSSVAESKHAIGIEANGMEMLIHVGVDTVNMQGDGFTCLVKEGDEVKLGQPLIRFDREKIKAAGYSDTVAVLLTNSDDLEGVECGAK
jgi:PTS system sucrose-specific IIC component